MRDITAEDKAMLNYMRNSLDKGIGIKKSITEFAIAYGMSYGTAHIKWYGEPRKSKENSLRSIYLREKVGNPLFPEKRVEPREGKKKSLKASELFSKIDSMNNNTLDKINDIQDDVRKYVDNIEKSVSHELKTITETIKAIYEVGSPPKQLKVTDKGYYNPKYQTDRGGEVRLLSNPPEIGFNEKKVNELIKDIEEHEKKIELLKENLSEQDIILQNKDNRILELENSLTELVVEIESKDLSLNQSLQDTTQGQEEIIRLKELVGSLENTINTQQETINGLNSRGLIGRLFNKVDSGVSN